MNDTAIVIQGAMSFHTEKILDYYSNFNCTLILSTYHNTIHFNTNKYPNFHVVLSDMPSVRGLANRNCQRITTYKGLKKAEELGIKYCLKTRTDHFFKNPNTLNILKLNIQTYPAINAVNQNERIIVPNGGTTLNQKWGSYHVSDHWLYGRTSDLIDYFDIQNHAWNPQKEFNLKTPTSPEPEFAQLWMLSKNLYHATFSSLLQERFIVLDNQSLYYDVVKDPNINIFEYKTDWKAWCDPLTVHSRMWFNFFQGKTYSIAEEATFNANQIIP